MSRAVYKRVLLKLSGESLLSEDGKDSISSAVIDRIADEIKRACDSGVQIAIVIGGGNIFRGISKGAVKMERVTADQMGMLATVINSLALKDALRRTGAHSKVYSSVLIDGVADSIVAEKVINDLDDNIIPVLAGGTGNPFFSTDTAAALRAAEIKADVVLKATRVDGIYNADPEKDENAELFEYLTFREVHEKELRVMDLTAISLCSENHIPIRVFNLNKDDNIYHALCGEKLGTIVDN